MYIWIGCDISPRFVEYREKVKLLSEELGFNQDIFNLPQHVSLKITFEMEEEVAKHCIKDIIELLKQEKPFTAKIVGMERIDGILWLRVEENEQFTHLHNELDEIGISYAVKPHKFDKEFIYHSTVMMDGDNAKLDALFEKLKDTPYPEELKINTFLVGYSDDNVNYKIARRIKVK